MKMWIFPSFHHPMYCSFLSSQTLPFITSEPPPNRQSTTSPPCWDMMKRRRRMTQRPQVSSGAGFGAAKNPQEINEINPRNDGIYGMKWDKPPHIGILLPSVLCLRFLAFLATGRVPWQLFPRYFPNIGLYRIGIHWYVVGILSPRVLTSWEQLSIDQNPGYLLYIVDHTTLSYQEF